MPHLDKEVVWTRWQEAFRRLHDDVEAMSLFRLQTWAWWQRRLLLFTGLIGSVVVLGTSWLLSERSSLRRLDQQITSLRTTIAKSSIVQPTEPALVVDDCALTAAGRIDEYLEDRLDTAALEQFDRVRYSDRSVIKAEVREAYEVLAQIIACISADTEWQLSLWHIRRDDGVPVARIEMERVLRTQKASAGKDKAGMSNHGMDRVLEEEGG